MGLPTPPDPNAPQQGRGAPDPDDADTAGGGQPFERVTPAAKKVDDAKNWEPVPGRPGIERHRVTGALRTNIPGNSLAR